MKKYETPEIKIIKFETEDIITTSSPSADIDGGSVQFPEGWIQP